MRFPGFLMIVVMATACASTPVGPLASGGVRNFDQVNRDLSRGAQPTAAGVAALAQLHVATIVNLRPENEDRRAFSAEKSAADRLNITDVPVPLDNWKAPSADQVRQVLAIISDPAKQPVFVHCQRGADRTGTVIAIYRIVHDCWTADRAIQEAREHGMGWWQLPMKRFIRQWYWTMQTRPCTPMNGA